MRLPTYPPSALAAFARLHQLQLNGTSISHISPDVGLGMLFHPEQYNPAHRPLLTIDKDLVLSVESIESAAKSDHWIRDVLRACCGLLGGDAQGDGKRGKEAGTEKFPGLELELEDEDEGEGEEIQQSGRNPRLMIMLFLAVMVVRGAVEAEGSARESEQRRKVVGVGSGGVWSEYIKFLPEVSIPTTWTEEECALLRGTSLDTAIVSKKGALAREFHAFQRLTSSLAWCRQYLWNPSSSSSFTLSNWIQIDAWYRSRVLELPGLGVCLIPYLDMVNHSDDGANAYYNLTDDGDVVLLPIETEEEGNMLSIHTKNSTEIRINYGTHKSSAELLFSYGFLNKSQTCLWLSLPIPLSSLDPLTPAKEKILSRPPSVKLIDLDSTEIAWISLEIWLIVTNAEDGLEFNVLQQIDGTRELKLYWRSGDDDDTIDGGRDGVMIEDIDTLKRCLEGSRLWEVYHLRAVVTLQQVIAEKLQSMNDADDLIGTIEESARLASIEGRLGNLEHSLQVRESVVNLARELRAREWSLLQKSITWFEEEKGRLVATDVVQKYLAEAQEGESDTEAENKDDEDLS